MNENNVSFFENLKTFHELIKTLETKKTLVEKEIKSTTQYLLSESEEISKSLIIFNRFVNSNSQENNQKQCFSNPKIEFSTKSSIPYFFQIRRIMLHLYYHPITVYQILKNSTDHLTSLCNLFSIQLYDNPFRPDIPIDEQYFIILTQTLKDEISTFTTFNRTDQFLNKQSINRNLLNSLINRSEVKAFFVNSLQNIITQIDYNENLKGITFDFEELNTKIENMNLNKNIDDAHINKGDIQYDKDNVCAITSELRQPLDRAMNLRVAETSQYQRSKLSKKLTFNQKESIDINFNSDDHLTKFFNFFGKSLKKKDLADEINNTENDSKKDYLSKQIGFLGNDLNLFDVSNLIDKIYTSKEPVKIFKEYSKQFEIVVPILNLFFDTIYKFLKLMPLSIKYILTIIAKLFRKKHMYIQPYELTGMLMRFYFQIIIEPLINNLDVHGLTTFLSSSTLNILKIITKVINQMFSGKMFNSKDNDTMFLPFNHFFIENIGKFSNFFDEVINEELSSQVTTIIENDNITDELVYCDFFKDHPNVLINKRNIYVTLPQFIQVYHIMKNSLNSTPDEKININEISKAFNQINISIIEKEINDKEENYICFSDFEKVLNPNIMLFKYLQSQKANQNEESSIDNSDLSKTCNLSNKDNVIKVMRYLKHILMNCIPSVIPEKNFFGFELKTMDDFIFALNAMKNINYEQIINKGETLLYLNLFIQGVKEIQTLYKDNNYELFFSESIQYTKELIQLYDIDIILKLKRQIDYFQNLNEYKEHMIVIMKQIKLNKQVLDFIRNEKLLVRLTLSIGKRKEDVKFQIKEIQELQEDKTRKKLLRDITIMKRYCSSISDFVQKFESLCETDSGTFPKEGILQTLLFYCNNCIYPKVKNIPSVKEILRDYIMNKIYKCIFPISPSEKDQRIISHIENDNKLTEDMNMFKKDFEDLFEKVKILFDNMKKARNPNEKFIQLNKIVHLWNMLSEKLDKNSKDEMFLLLEYLLAYAKPEMLYSNLMFVKEYKDFIDVDVNELTKIMNDFEGIINVYAQ